MPHDDLREAELTTLARLFESLAHPARIAILANVGKLSLQEIAKIRHSSPPALQRHVNTLRDTGLIEREQRSYRLTDIGKQIVKMVDQFAATIPHLQEREKDVAKQKIKAVAFGSGLTSKDMADLFDDLQKKTKFKK